jgi:hypothetical protein
VNTEAEEQNVEEIVETDLLSEVFGDRYPLSEMGEETPETPAAETEEKVDEVPATTAESVAAKPEAIAPKRSDAEQAGENAGLMAALMAERQKRQALERQIAAKPKEPTRFNWDNPEQTIEAIKAELRQENQTNLLNLSEANAQARHDDYDAKYQVFVGMAQENPALIQAMLQQPDPAEYAYQLASQRIFQNEVGADPQTYRDKLRAELRLEIEAEMKSAAQSRQDVAASLPPSAKSMTDRRTPVENIDDDPLGSLFPGEHRS